MRQTVSASAVADHIAAVLADVFGAGFQVQHGQSDTKSLVAEVRWIDGPPVPLLAQVVASAFEGSEVDAKTLTLHCYRGLSEWRFEGARAMLAIRAEDKSILEMSREELSNSQQIIETGLGADLKLGKAFTRLIDSMMFEWDVPSYSEYCDPKSPKHWRNRK